MMEKSLWRKDVVGWSLYDFANTIYSMNIVSLYLKRYIVEDLGKGDYYFDIPFSASMFVAAMLLPALGAMSDQCAKKRTFLFLFTVTCCISVGGMALLPPGMILLTMLLFALANFSYEAGQPFYNSLLYSVADGRQARFVSGIGVSFGYVGAILGMILVLPFVTGSVYAWDVPFLEAGGKKASFIPTALLFLIFALPIFAWVKESGTRKSEPISWKTSYRDVWEGIRQTKKYPGVLRFLIADYFFEDAVATAIINIGIYCSLVMGLADTQITTFLIISTISAVLGSVAIGKIAQHCDLKKVITVIVIGWVITLFLFVFIDSMVVVWILGSAVGVFMGGLWTTTRPYLAELVPRGELGRFFGLFSLSGRAAAMIGPLIWTIMVYLFNPDRLPGRSLVKLLDINDTDSAKLPYKVGILSLAVMMLIGLYIFRKVPGTKRGLNG